MTVGPAIASGVYTYHFPIHDLKVCNYLVTNHRSL